MKADVVGTEIKRLATHQRPFTGPDELRHGERNGGIGTIVGDEFPRSTARWRRRKQHWSEHFTGALRGTIFADRFKVLRKEILLLLFQLRQRRRRLGSLRLEKMLQIEIQLIEDLVVAESDAGNLIHHLIHQTRSSVRPVVVVVETR